MAGAKSTIASYWKVNDSATQTLMDRFYNNLIEYGKNANSSGQDPNSTTVRIDALIKAQRSMLNEFTDEDFETSANRDAVKGKKKTNNKKKSNLQSKPNSKKRLHPRYWAAFVLSGDWR